MTLMDSGRWKVLEPLLDRALDLPGEERAMWLASLRTSDPDLADDVDALLADAAAAEDRGFLARPVEVTLAGLQVGGYTLERLIGHGGMGSVWLARRTDGRFDGVAAVKLLNLSLASAAGHARFRREGSMLARLAHPGIARLLDAGVSSAGQPYLLLEYVEGEPIDEFAERRALSTEDRVRLIVRVLDAVGQAHANLIVHRDLKPSNILVTADGTVKLLDFGIAKLLDSEEAGVGVSLTVEGSRLFTPEYAAPEQVFGDTITTATDVYAAGILLYMLVCGKHPTAHHCRTREEMIRALRDVQPAKVDAGDLDVVLSKALRKDGEERYQTAASFAGDLERWLAHKPVSARPPSFAYRTGKFARRNRAALAGSVAVTTLLIVYSVTVTFDRERLARALSEATTSARRADQVTDFTVSLFEPTGGGNAFGDSVSARQLLARTAANAREFSGQPLIEAQLLDLIGRIRTTVGAYAEARPLLEEALAIRQRILGAEHPDVATSLVNLAELMSATAEDAQAVPLLRRATDMRTRSFGENDARTADALYALATAMHVSGDYRGAKPLFEKWFSLIQSEPPQVTPVRAQQLSDFSIMLAIGGQYERAEALTRDALALDRALYGPTHSRVGIELSHLGAILADRRQLGAADSALRQGVALLRANFPNGHVELADALRNLGYHLGDIEHWDEAESTWREAADVYRRTQGQDGLGYANASIQVGRAQVAHTDYARAEHTLRTALRLRGATGSPTSPVAVRGRIYLGEALRGQGRLAEAESLLLLSYRQKTLARGLREYAAVSLAKLYEAEGRTDEAIKYRTASAP